VVKHLKLFVCSIALAAACLPAQAQDFSRFKIPFDFAAGAKQLKAGTYVISKALPNSNIAWMLRNVDTSDAVILPTNSIESPINSHRTSMVFHANHGQYSLYQFWLDQHEGRVMQPSNSKAQYNQEADVNTLTVEVLASKGN
jgi:hypothetical protein